MATALNTAMDGEFSSAPAMVKTGNEAFLKTAFDDSAIGVTPDYLNTPAQDWSLNINFETVDITPIGYGESKLKVPAGRTITGSMKMFQRTDSEALAQFIQLYADISYDEDGAGVGLATVVNANPNKKAAVQLAIDEKHYYEAEIVVTSISQGSGSPNAGQTFDVNFEINGDLLYRVLGA